MDNLFLPQLSSGEKLLWTGYPPRGLRIRASDAFMIPFSLLWGGFAIFWETTVIASGGPIFFMIWGIPFVFVGLYLIAGRFWMDAWQRAKTVYALTSERAVIVSGLFSRHTKSLSLDTLTDISLTQRHNGDGIITFGYVPPFYAWYGGTAWPGFGQHAVPSFELSGEACTVYELIRQAQRAAKAASMRPQDPMGSPIAD